MNNQLPTVPSDWTCLGSLRLPGVILVDISDVQDSQYPPGLDRASMGNKPVIEIWRRLFNGAQLNLSNNFVDVDGVVLSDVLQG